LDQGLLCGQSGLLLRRRQGQVFAGRAERCDLYRL
jgi:hypothetical protein